MRSFTSKNIYIHNLIIYKTQTQETHFSTVLQVFYNIFIAIYQTHNE